MQLGAKTKKMEKFVFLDRRHGAAAPCLSLPMARQRRMKTEQ
jgi:hypothetical protein